MVAGRRKIFDKRANYVERSLEQCLKCCRGGFLINVPIM